MVFFHTQHGSALLEGVKYQNEQQLKLQENENQQLFPERMEEKHLEFQNLTLKLFAGKNPTENKVCFPQNAICSVIDKFFYNPDEEITFASYFKRYEDLFNTDCKDWTDLKKSRLLLSKLSTSEHTKFANYILPQKAYELLFTEIVNILRELFSRKTSLFHKRWKCLNLVRKEQDFMTIAAVVNKHCDDFKLAELSADNFKCLIFVQGLVAAKDAEIRQRTLNKLQNEPNATDS